MQEKKLGTISDFKNSQRNVLVNYTIKCIVKP